MGSTTVNSAPSRNYAQETQDTLATQIALAPDLYASEAKYQPMYNQLQMQLAQEAVLGRESGFDTWGYSQSRPDLARNWQNARNNPEGETEKGILRAGSFENYVKQDWEGSGADPAFASGGAGEDMTAALDGVIKLALEQRTAARERKDFAASDAIRDGLASLGITIEDTAQGPRWSISRDGQ